VVLFPPDEIEEEGTVDSIGSVSLDPLRAILNLRLKQTTTGHHP
jgi:hypothetical protein